MEALLTPEQYAARAQLHPDSVRRQLREGTLRGIKKGRVWRIPASVLHEDSRQAKRSTGWAAAAAVMADVYTNSLSNNDDLTAITTADGEFYEDAIKSPTK